jgi:hypothetical protein
MANERCSVAVAEGVVCASCATACVCGGEFMVEAPPENIILFEHN